MQYLFYLNFDWVVYTFAYLFVYKKNSSKIARISKLNIPA